MSKKLYIITQDKYSGHRRTLGFLRFLNNDLYYDFSLLKDNHTSYHKDGSVWRTSIITGEKPVKEEQKMPLADFKGLYNLGVVLLSKDTIPHMPKVKKKYFDKHETFSIDIESFPSETLNLIPEIIQPEYEIELPEKEKATPPNSISKTFTDFTPWVCITVLGHEENLLIEPREKGFIVNHFNERFTANKKGVEYSSESYGGQVFREHSKES